MGIQTFKIMLDNELRQYRPGDTVTGHLHVRKTGEESTYEITVKFIGEARTEWSEGGGDNESPRRYTGRQTYFDTTKLLFGDRENWEALPSDDMLLPFSFILPASIILPQNCQFQYGSIRYGLEAVLKKPWYNFDVCAPFRPIYMAAPTVDLNSVAGVDLPIDQTVSKRFGFFFKSGPLQITAKALERGVCIGKTLTVEVTIINHSTEAVSDLTGELVQMWRFLGRHLWYQSLRDFKKTVAKVERGEGIPSESEYGIVWQLLMKIPEEGTDVVPTLPYSTCEIIKMEYFISVKAVMGPDDCCGKQCVELTFPVTVGNTPLENKRVTDNTIIRLGKT